MDRLLDEQRAGPAYLRMPAIAEVVADSIGNGATGDYLLHAWVVMPNHVHLLITPQVEVPTLLRRLKGVSARESNQLLGQTGQPFWQDESYDRLVAVPASASESRTISSRTRCEPGWLDRQRNTHGRVSRGRAG